MDADITHFLNDLSVQGPLIAKALQERHCELRKERDARRRAEDELRGMKELTDVLLNLIEKVWVFVCSSDQSPDGSLSRQYAMLESILDSALAQLELQSVQIDYEQLRQENDQLRVSSNRQLGK